MKARLRVRLAALVALGLAAGTAMGQAAPPPIPRAARAVETDADLQQYKPAINAFVNEKVAALMGEDPSARSAAREAIFMEVPNGASTIYLKTFADSLNVALLPAFAKATPVQKLNVAITVAKVADRSVNSSLAGVTRQMLKDPSEPVVLWAMKASQSMVPFLAANKLDPNVALIGEIGATARKRNSPWVIEEAYPALTLGKADPTTPDAQMTAMIGVVLPEVQKLVAHRTTLYANGVPPQPMADSKATFFLSSTGTWKKLNAVQRVAVVQQMVDLLQGAITRFVASPPSRGELTPFIKQVGKAFWVVGSNVSSPALQAASDGVSTITQSTQPTLLQGSVATLFTATAAIKEFASVKLPTIAATQPTAAATGVR